MISRFTATFSLIMALVFTVALAGDTAPREPTDNPRKQGTKLASHYRGKLQLSDEEFDFGYMPRSSRVSHQFWIKNVGDDTLQIVDIKPG